MYIYWVNSNKFVFKTIGFLFVIGWTLQPVRFGNSLGNVQVQVT